MIRSRNGLTIEAYSGITRIVDASSGLVNASNLRFTTQYPGGIYGTASFYVPREVVRQWAVKGAQRLIFRNGRTVCYEGKIDDLDRALQATTQGITVTANGYWGALMNRRRLRRIWADTRITEDKWVWDETVNGAELIFLDRNNRIRFTPKAEAFTSGQGARVVYTMPTGRTVARVSFNYALAEGAQAWRFGLYNVGTTSVEWSVTSSGSGSTDVVLGTPSQAVRFFFDAQANQTPTSDGTYYGQASNIRVNDSTNDITTQQLVQDIISDEMSSELNSSTSLVGANTYDLDGSTGSPSPIFFDRFETVAEALNYVGNIGDGSQNQWHAYLDHSETANTPAGTPVLAIEQRPVLTSWDYVVEVGRDVEPTLSIVRDYSQIRNWIIVEYIDERGYLQYVTPDDDASLTDSTSSGDYGQLDAILSVGEATTAQATNFGARFLARYKDPIWTTTSPINVKDGIRTSSGNIIPASQIRAGQRIKIANYLDPNLVFLISGTSYDDERETTAITAGPVDFWMYNAFSFPPASPAETESKESTATAAAPVERHGHWEEYGYTQAEWQKLPLKERLKIRGIG